jgi:hypothetical protein
MRALVSLIVLAGLLAAGRARAQGPAVDPAQAHFDRGAALTAERQYAEAARAFEASWLAAPRKETLFAWAQVERLAGNCAAATDLYRRFLAQPELTAAQREAAELNIRRCETTPGNQGGKTEAAPDPATPVRVPVPSPPAAAGAPARVEGATPAPARRGGIVRVALLAGSATSLVGAATFFQLARNDERDAAAAPVWDDYYGAMNRARGRQRLAAGLLAGSAALGAGALLQWMLSRPGPPLAAWVGPGAGGLGGRF